MPCIMALVPEAGNLSGHWRTAKESLGLFFHVCLII